MELKNTDELLFVKGFSKNYAFEFSYIAEICSGTQISKIPCLPEHFVGVCSHKGEIVPVAQIEDTIKDGTEITLIISCQGFSMGILCQGTTYIKLVQEGMEIQKPEGEASGTLWAEKAIVQDGTELYTVIDLEKTILDLAQYFQEKYLYF